MNYYRITPKELADLRESLRVRRHARLEETARAIFWSDPSTFFIVWPLPGDLDTRIPAH